MCAQNRNVCVYVSLSLSLSLSLFLSLCVFSALLNFFLTLNFSALTFLPLGSYHLLSLTDALTSVCTMSRFSAQQALCLGATGKKGGGNLSSSKFKTSGRVRCGAVAHDAADGGILNCEQCFSTRAGHSRRLPWAVPSFMFLCTFPPYSSSASV